MSALVLWRHSPTDDNAQGRLQGSRDVPLGERGRAVAARAAERIVATQGDRLRVVSSPLVRARASADVLAGLVGATTEVDEAFTQRSYGVWEGLTWDEVRERWPEDYARRMRGQEPRIPGWGASTEVGERVAAGLRALHDPERTTVVVSHGSAIQLGVMHLIGVPAGSRVFGSVAHGAWHVLSQASSGAWHIDAYGLGAD